MKFTKTGLIKENLDSKSSDMIQAIADKYSYGEILDAIESFYIKNDEQVYAEMARKHAKEFRDFLDSEDEIDAFIKDFRDWVKNELTISNDSFISEQGDVEKWRGNVNKKRALESLDNTIEYLEGLKK